MLMKQPVKPNKPCMPVQPKEFVDATKDAALSLYNNASYTLQHIVDQILEQLGLPLSSAIDLSKIRISIDVTPYSDGEYDNNSFASYEGMPIRSKNPKYAKELIKYNKDMVKYTIAMQKFEIKNAQYILDKKEYDNWITEQEIANAKAILKKHNILVQ